MRILLADDERPTRNELGRILAELDPRDSLFEASSGEEALQAMQMERFHLLVIDMDLGDMMGTSVAWAAQSMQPGVPIIFATAYYDRAVKALALGAVDYVLKPFDPFRVSLAVRRAKAARPPAECVQVDELPLQDDRIISLVDIHEVYYIETHNRGCLIHTAESVYEDPTVIGVFEKRLEGKGFLRPVKDAQNLLGV